MNEDFYKTTKHNVSTDRTRRDLISIRFCKGCSVSINGDENKEYSIVFFEDNNILYKTQIRTNSWSKILKQYFGNYKVEVYHNGELIKSEKLDLFNKTVLINIDSHSLGDSLAWIPQVDKFQKLHNCVVYVKCNWKELFEKSYPNLNFCDVYGEIYAEYTIGYFKEWNDRAPSDPRLTSLSKVAADILGLPYEEIKPKLLTETVVSDKKYVCIATQSTAQCKYWNNKNGWNEVVKYLNNLGYEVWCIDKHKSFGRLPNLNGMPIGAVDKTGDFPLSERIKQISGAEFFIGLGSGLSWLAWALNKSVILISGFSKPFAEFDTPYRVFNEHVCNGCWNDTSLKFDPANWFWCPRAKNFECSSEISFEMVKDKIDKCLTDLKSNVLTEKSFVKDVFLKKYYNLLAHRKDTFKKMFEYLESLKKEEYLIVETGICRTDNNFSGDGMSSLMFDEFINYHNGRFITIDINKENVNFAKTKLSKKAEIINEDSVVALENISRSNKLVGVDLLYLDSFDVDWKNPHLSALHHLKEMVSAKEMIKDHTLIVVDDNRKNSGKGMYVSDYMSNLNKEKYFDEYQIGWIFKNKKDLLQDFEWGVSSDWFISTVRKEIFEKRIYEKINNVESDDIVVDFGASVGPFIKTIIEKNPKHVYAFEPCNDFFLTLQKNIKGNNITLLNYGIHNNDSDDVVDSKIFSFKQNKQSTMRTMSFKTFLEKFKIEKIDFLKTDCEGGEYHVFNDDNLEWILKNVRKISGEWHLNEKHDMESKDKFRKFRDTYLKKFKEFKIFAVDGTDITWDIWNEHFINYYKEVIIHINN